MHIDHNLENTRFIDSNEWKALVEFCDQNDFTDELTVRLSEDGDVVDLKWQDREEKDHHFEGNTELFAISPLARIFHVAT